MNEMDEVTPLFSDNEEDSEDDYDKQENEDYEDEEEPIMESTYVIVNYEGSFFPGVVTRVKKTSYIVNCMTPVARKSGPPQWKFPDVPDTCEYQPKEIVKAIPAPDFANTRGYMWVPDVDKYWI